MTSPEQRLHQQLESAIQEFLLASRAQVAATLDRAFDTAVARSSASRLKSATRRQQVPKLGKRRSASELTALSEQLYGIRFTGACSCAANGGASWPLCRSKSNGRLRLQRGVRAG
jgi:hypothetical protein